MPVGGPSLPGSVRAVIPAATPAALLAALTEAPPGSEITMPRLSPELAQRVAGGLGRPSATVDELVLEMREAPERRLAELVRGAAPPEVDVEALLGPGGIRAVALPTTGINAYATFASNGLPLVIVNQGLISFNYNLLRILATRFRFGGPDDASTPPLPALAETAAKVGELLEWSTLPSVIPRVATFPVTRPQVEMASALAVAAERFVVAHEFAHLFLGHHARAAGHRTGTVGGRSVEVERYAWELEREADRAAVDLILTLAERRAVDAPLAWAGVELFFAAVMLLADARGDGAGADDESHPPPAQRLAAVRDRLAEIAGADGSRVAAVRRVAEPVLALLADLRSAALDAARSGARAAQAEVRRLIGACAAGPAPDHARFRPAITALLDRHPAATLAVIGEELTAAGPHARNRRILAASFAGALPGELRGLLTPAPHPPIRGDRDAR